MFVPLMPWSGVSSTQPPMLLPMRLRLSELIKEACKEYQKIRDGATSGIVKKDTFTLKAIDEAGLEGRDRTLAVRIGTAGGGKSTPSRGS